MEQFDKMLKEMAEQEECIMPDGFDKRLQQVLDTLPPRAVRRGLGAAKIALIAAAACALLMGTALAASPGLRELLAQTLGSFAPYAQEQGGEAYVMDGIEVRVLSAMADQDTVRVYAQFKDLEGSRLSEHINCLGIVEIPQSYESGIESSTFGSRCLLYNEEMGTALVVFSNWGRAYKGLSNASLIPLAIYDTQTNENIVMDATVRIPLDIEVMPVTTIGGDTELSKAFFAESIRLSPLGLTAVSRAMGGQYSYLARVRLRLAMADGTEILSQREDGGPDGQGDYGEYGTDASRRVLIWNFPEPLTVEEIRDVTIIDCLGGERSFPVELP